MVGVNRAPIRRHQIVRVFCIARPERLFFLIGDFILRRMNASGPGNGYSGITVFGILHNKGTLSRLSAAVNLNEPRQILGPLRITINRRKHRLLALECSNPKSDHLYNHTVLFPLLEHLDIQRLFARVKTGPCFLNSRGCNSVFDRRQRISTFRHGTKRDQSQAQRVKKSFI